MFERRTNFDLRRLLSGAEPCLYSLLSRLEWDLAMGTSSLQCLKVEPVLRKSVADVLVPTSKIKVLPLPKNYAFDIEHWPGHFVYDTDCSGTSDHIGPTQETLDTPFR